MPPWVGRAACRFLAGFSTVALLMGAGGLVASGAEGATPAGPGLAADRPTTFSTTFFSCDVVFEFQLCVNTFVVPPGVSDVQIDATGGWGGKGTRGLSDSGNPGGAGGAPAKVSGTLPVKPGDKINISAGGNGDFAFRAPVAKCPNYDNTLTDPELGGRSLLSGGSGGRGDACNGGSGGGGGAATVVTLNSPIQSQPPVLVAGGGGGGGGGGGIAENSGGGGGAGFGIGGANGSGVGQGTGGIAAGASATPTAINGADATAGANDGGGGGGGGGYPGHGGGGHGGARGGGGGGGGAGGDSFTGGAANTSATARGPLLFDSITTTPAGEAGGKVTVTWPAPVAQVFASVAPAQARQGRPITFSATVQDYHGVTVPTGRVDFAIGSSRLCSTSLNPDPGGLPDRSQGSCTSSLAPPGGSSVVATYVPDKVFGTAKSAPLPITVTPVAAVSADLSTTVSAPPTARVGDLVPVAVTVTNSGPNEVAAQSRFLWSPGFTLVSSGGGTVSVTGNYVVFRPPTLSPGGVATLSVTLRASRAGPSILVAGTNATDGTPDPRPGNNVAGAPTTITSR